MARAGILPAEMREGAALLLLCPGMPLRKGALLTLLLGIFLFAAIGTVLVAVRPSSSTDTPGLEGTPLPPTPRLASHVLLVVIDGLRWDIAADPAKMPRLSAAMRRHSSGVLMTGRITMTSSAVLAFGTGLRGDLDQVLENLHPPLTGVNDWIHNAKRAGLRVMVAGDPAWSHLYGSSLSEFLPDPEGVGIDFDFNAQTFRNLSHLHKQAPDVLVGHFVTPDHQGHAYGIRSSRYAKHVRDFERQLFDWLDTLGPNWTIIVTSDHGAAESGTHGTDTIEQRKCPFVAYGPGIRSRYFPQQALDQVDFPGLFSALLGTPNAQQSRGSIPFDWLDTPASQVRLLACREIARVSALTATVRSPESEVVKPQAHECCVPATASVCDAQARKLSEAYDRIRGDTEGIGSGRHLGWLSLALAAALAIAWVFQGRLALSVIGIGSLWLALSLGLTYGVERLPGIWPNGIRAVVFSIGNLTLLALAVRFKHWAPWLERHAALALSVVPGWLLVSYTANTQVEALAALVVLGALLYFAARTSKSRNVSTKTRCLAHYKGCHWFFLSCRLIWIEQEGRKIGRICVVLLGVTSIAVLAIVGTHASDVTPRFFTVSPRLAAIAVGAALAMGLVYLLGNRVPDDVFASAGGVTGPQLKQKIEHRGPPLALIVSSLLIVLTSFVLRHEAVSWVGRLAWIASAIGAGSLVLTRRYTLAFVLGVTSTVWVSRDFECAVLISALVAASIIGRAASNALGAATRIESSKRAWCWIQITFLFALSYLLWIGLQGGLQLNAMDFTAGTFGDSHVPHWLVATCLAYKFLLAEALLVTEYLRATPADERAPLLRGLVLAHLARSVVLLLMLTVCGHSYWTAFRVLADLPFALVGVLGVGIVGLLGGSNVTRRQTHDRANADRLIVR